MLKYKVIELTGRITKGKRKGQYGNKVHRGLTPKRAHSLAREVARRSGHLSYIRENKPRGRLLFIYDRYGRKQSY